MAERSEPPAAVVHRLGVLLAAGVPPGSAWSHLGSAGGRTAAIADRIAGGTAPSAAILAEAGPGEPAWRGLAAAWAVATEAGAPLAPSLRAFADVLRDIADSDRAATVALAGPASTARMVVVLPVIGVLFGVVMGFDTIGTLFGTPVGLLCLVAGVLLMLLSRWWSRRLVARARPSGVLPGLRLDLVAIAVSGGGALGRSIATVDQALIASGVPLDDSSVLEEVLALSRRAGVPAAELLRAEAGEARREARAAAQRDSATLATTLMLPLGLCVLPAFMLLAVVPLLLSVVSSTVGAL